MPSLPPVGALWIGGSLTWLEQLCLKSFVHHGHPTYLFTYGDVKKVPEGVIIRDGNEVLPTQNFILHERTQSVALFSDLFRFHMIKTDPDMIYVDTDVYCVRPIDLTNPYIFGYQSGTSVVNGAVLRLPGNSKLLHAMLEFMKDEYPQPHWFPKKLLDQIRQSHEDGSPMHIGEMPWGVWGPGGITALAQDTGEIKHALDRDYFYPVEFRERRSLFKRPMITTSKLSENSRTIHMWAPIKRFAAAHYDGLCPPNSYIGSQLELHGIDPADAPIPKTKARAVVY